MDTTSDEQLKESLFLAARNLGDYLAKAIRAERVMAAAKEKLHETGRQVSAAKRELEGVIESLVIAKVAMNTIKGEFDSVDSETVIARTSKRSARVNLWHACATGDEAAVLQAANAYGDASHRLAHLEKTLQRLRPAHSLAGNAYYTLRDQRAKAEAKVSEAEIALNAAQEAWNVACKAQPPKVGEPVTLHDDVLAAACVLTGAPPEEKEPYFPIYNFDLNIVLPGDEPPAEPQA